MRKIAALSLLLSSLVVMTPSRVSADDRAVLVPEPIARKAVMSSPQTTGPNGGTLSWGLDRIDQRGAVTSTRSYAYSNDGTGVNIYVLDSGVDGDHPEFGARVLPGWSYRGSGTALSDYNSKLDSWVQNPNANPRPGIKPCTISDNNELDPATFDNPAQPDTSDTGRTDNDGHGTHVAGIAAGDSVGVAKNANIIPVRALDSCGSGTITMIREGLAWILADHDAGEKAVLNLSVGFGLQVSDVDDDITALMDEGVVVVAAAGNSSTTACNNTPASTPGTISVASTNIFDGESGFTNYGICVDIFAPGGTSTQGGQEIESAYPYLSGVTNTYFAMSGTSMAAPFVTGAVARYLQSLAVVPSNFATGATAAWNWLDANATTNAVRYLDSGRSPQSPNKLVHVPAPALPQQVTGLVASPVKGGAVVEWSGGVSGVTYTAVATPGGASCSVVGGSTCTLSGLTNGATYSISVTGKNAGGIGPGNTTTVAVGTAPAAPVTLTATSGNALVTLNWSASSSTGATYVVTSSPSSAGCTTTATSCVISGLKNGTVYTFSISVVESSFGLQSVSSVSASTRPGFTVKKSVVKKGSRTTLTSLLSTPSKGRKTWSESGPCSISSGRLVAPKRVTSCTVKLTVAKAGSYPKMSTSLKVTIQ